MQSHSNLTEYQFSYSCTKFIQCFWDNSSPQGQHTLTNTRFCPHTSTGIVRHHHPPTYTDLSPSHTSWLKLLLAWIVCSQGQILAKQHVLASPSLGGLFTAFFQPQSSRQQHSSFLNVRQILQEGAQNVRAGKQSSCYGKSNAASSNLASYCYCTKCFLSPFARKK